ncbi:MAG: hypothetical protein IKU55_04505, partial [Clostridia bacterium]|nr:hypothetical protein [Clostridia bacterium]
MRNDKQSAQTAIKTKKQMEELITNKMLLVFGASAVYLFLISLIRNSGVVGGRERSVVTSVVFLAIMAITLILTCVGSLLHHKMRRNGGKPEEKLFNWLHLSLTSLTIFFCTASQYFFSALGAKAAYIIIIAAAGLAILYWLVRRECFVSMLVIGLSTVVFYLLYTLPNALTLWMNAWTYIEIAYAVAWVVSALLLWLLSRKNGVLSFGKCKVRILSERFQYLPVWIALAAVAVLFAACAVLGIHL